jgi:hypothetical protein
MGLPAAGLVPHYPMSMRYCYDSLLLKHGASPTRQGAKQDQGPWGDFAVLLRSLTSISATPEEQQISCIEKPDS